MLAALRELPVAAGDAIFVPAGTPHAIGAGILLARAAGADRPVGAARVGRIRLAGEEEHLGLGWDGRAEALDRAARDPEPLRGPAPEPRSPPSCPRPRTPTSAPSASRAATARARASRSCS